MKATNYLVKVTNYLIIGPLVIMLVGCSNQAPKNETHNTVQSSPQLSAFVNDLVEIQSRNFEPTVNYCHELEPASSKKIKSQYTNYIAFYRTTMMDVWNNLAQSSEYKDQILGQTNTYTRDEKLMEIQSTQGTHFLSAAQAQPAQVCAKVSQMMAQPTASTIRQEVEGSLAEYKARRALFCAKEPKPENCKE